MNYYSIFDSGREEASHAASPVCCVFHMLTKSLYHYEK